MKHPADTALNTLWDQVEEWGIGLTGEQASLLARYGHLLEKYDRANVIGTKVYERILEDHVLDSLSCLLVRGFETASSLVDVGTGGGFPGIPLAVARPSLSASLIESVAKKVSFLEYAVADLDLQNVSLLKERAEQVAVSTAHRGSYDLATTRAVSSLAVVAEYCVPLVRVGGRVIAMKGRLTDEELEEGRRAAKALGGGIADVVQVPWRAEVRMNQRCLVVIEKERETPKQYPRRPGTPQKYPLGRDIARK